MTKFLTMVFVTAALATGDSARAAEAPLPAPADSTLERIGTVQGDTLYVSREKVVSTALLHNEMLAASGAMRDAADARSLGAWQAFTPRLQVASFFMRSDDALSSFGFKLQNRGVTQADFNPAYLNHPGETNNFITRLQLLQPIFNGMMGLFGKQAADAAGRAAAFEHRRAEETVAFHAVQAWEGLALARSYERVMQKAVASAEGHERQAQSMVAAEMATKADLLQAQVYLSGLRQQLIEVRNMLALAGEQIKLLTATDTHLTLVAHEESLADPALPAVPDSQAVLHRSDLQARREQAVAADKMVGVARGAVLPHINLSVQRDLYSHNDLFGSDARSWTLGVYATMGFGVGDLGGIKQARAEHRAATHMVDFETRHAQVQATEAWLQVRAAWEKVEVARSTVEAAREGLRIVGDQYREGLAGMVELLDTQAAATMAEGNLVQALHDYRVGLANLEFAGAASTAAPEDDHLSPQGS